MRAGQSIATSALHEQVTARGHQFVMAERAGVATGFASYQVGCPAAGVVKLHKLYVLPEAQGQHIGGRLIEFICRTVRASQRALRLNVNKFNRARQVYHRMGFSVIGTKVIDIGEGYVMDDVIMQREIRQPGQV